MSSGNEDLCPVPSWKLEALPAWNGCGMSLVNHTLIQILLAIIPDRKPGSPHVQGSGSQANCLQVLLISSVCSMVTHKKRFAEENSEQELISSHLTLLLFIHGTETEVMRVKHFSVSCHGHG